MEIGLLEQMESVLKDEARDRRRQMARAKARRH